MGRQVGGADERHYPVCVCVYAPLFTWQSANIWPDEKTELLLLQRVGMHFNPFVSVSTEACISPVSY